MPKSLRILLADDHPMLRDGVAQSLQAEPGWRVVAQADNGLEMLVQARQSRPDLVLVDLSMPGPGGPELIRSLVADLPGVRVVVLTASMDGNDLIGALEAGAHGYVLKGISAAELRAIVRQVARGDHYVPPSLAAHLLSGLTRSRADPLARLTPRETEVLSLIAGGRTNREIGAQLHMAEKTVKHHVTQILDKLDLRSRTEAALLAQRRGVGTPG